MRNELSDRQQAIRMRLAGDTVSLTVLDCARHDRSCGPPIAALCGPPIVGWVWAGYSRLVCAGHDRSV